MYLAIDLNCFKQVNHFINIYNLNKLRKTSLVSFTDTDSLYMAISELELEAIIAEEKRDEYNAVRNEWLVPQRATDPVNYGLLRRKPGLFHEEFRGTYMIALAPKLYIAGGNDATKSAHKGVQKRNRLRREEYFATLQTQMASTATNMGFIVRNRVMVTYQQTKRATTYLYVKRRVLPDGIHTTNLHFADDDNNNGDGI